MTPIGICWNHSTTSSSKGPTSSSLRKSAWTWGSTRAASSPRAGPITPPAPRPAALVPEHGGLRRGNVRHLEVRGKEAPGKVGAEARQDPDGAAEAVGGERRVEGRAAGPDVLTEAVERHVPHGDELGRHSASGGSARKASSRGGVCVRSVSS